MRIGQILHESPFDGGGVQVHVRHLCDDLAARGHHVEVLSNAAAGGVAHGDGWSHESTRLRRPAAFEDGLATARSAAQWARERRLEVVHVHHVAGHGTALVPALRAAGRAVVATLHDYAHGCARGQMWSDEGRCTSLQAERCVACIATTWPGVPAPADPVAALRRRWVLGAQDLAAAHALVAPDPDGAALLASRWPHGPCPPLVVVENGIRAARLARVVAAWRARLPRRDPRVFVFGVAGALLPSKGVVEFARALSGCPDPHLALEVHGAASTASGSARCFEELRALAGADSRIRLAGPYPASRLPRILAGLDALAAPALWDEVHGFSVREGLAAGLRAAITQRGGLVGVPRIDPEALLLPAEDPAAWSGLVSAAVARWRAKAAEPRKVREALDCAKDLEALYERVLRQASSHAATSASPARLQS
jgi:glycosyltransferase involved in cell wall biosynthesis